MRRNKVALDERGAIMLLGLFFAIFGAAILYSVVGVSQALLFRQGLQDGADAGALSAAVMEARLMNAIVLVNILMSAILSVLVALKLVELLAIMGMMLATALAYPTFGASLAAIPILTPIQQNVHNLHDQLEDPISEGLKALYNVNVYLRDYAPAGIVSVVHSEFQHKAFAHPVQAGHLIGGEELPIEDGEYKVLCGKAAEFPVKMAEETLGPALNILGPLKAGMGAMAETFSEWFCGEGESGSPTMNQTEEVWYPQSQELTGCQDAVQDSYSQDWGAAAESIGQAVDCTSQAVDAEFAQPNEKSGSCRARCEVDGPYEKRVQQAREVCDPKSKTRWDEYAYQVVDGEVLYEWNGKGWTRNEPSYGRTYVENSKKPLCGTSRAEVDSAYNAVVRTSNDVNDLTVVCSNERAPEAGARSARANRQVVRFKEVRHVLGCMKEETITADVKAQRPGGFGESDDADDSGDSSSESSSESGASDSDSSSESASSDADSSEGASSDEGASPEEGDTTEGESSGEEGEENKEEDEGEMLPQRVKADVELGGEEFQLRTLVLGQDNVSSHAERVVRLALWGRARHENPVKELKVLGRVAVAQSEYFYDGTQGREEWMWNMKWRGRLVRFKPSEENVDAFNAECGGWASTLSSGAIGENPCRGFFEILEDLGPLVAH